MQAERMPVIALTSGEPAGIGPDICLDLAGRVADARVVVIGNLRLFQERAAQLHKSVSLRSYPAQGPAASGGIDVLDLPMGADCRIGHLDSRNSRYVLAAIERAYDGCVSGEFSAMVTAPVSKAVINEAGIPFLGHTEYLAERAGGMHVVMMLVGGGA